MIPMPPSGMRIFPPRGPWGRRPILSTSPTGSGRAITSSIPVAICSIRLSERARRSSMAPESPRDDAAPRSFRFSLRSHCACPRSPLAMAARAAFFSDADALPIRTEASLAARQTPITISLVVAVSPDPIYGPAPFLPSARSLWGEDHQIVPVHHLRGDSFAEDGTDLGTFLPLAPLQLLARPRRDSPGELLSPRVADGDGVP